MVPSRVDVNAPLIAAGCLALLGAGIHGVAGELLVLRRLSLEGLHSTPFGGPRMTKAMIQAAWHMTTVAFACVGVACLAAGSVLDGDTAKGLGVVAAAAMTGFAAIALGVGGAGAAPRTLLRHPGPTILTATAALAWWGAL
jgi:uncharacterized protein YjeT (DUF2065 family)